MKAAVHSPGILWPCLSLALRELLRFYRQKSRIIGTLGAPFLFWLFLGAGLGAALPNINTPYGKGYMEYFFPGNLLLTLLFTSIFSSISLIEDRREGFLQSVLVAPVSRFAIVGGKVAGGAFIALFQGVLFLLVLPLMGVIPSAVGVLTLFSGMLAVSFTMTALGFFFAWRFDSIQGFHSVMNLLLFPMWLLSGAFFPVAQAPAWLKPLMFLNPLTYGLGVLRSGIYEGVAGLEGSLPIPLTSLLIVLGFGLVFFWLSVIQIDLVRKEVSA